MIHILARSTNDQVKYLSFDDIQAAKPKLIELYNKDIGFRFYRIDPVPNSDDATLTRIRPKAGSVVTTTVVEDLTFEDV